MISSFLNFTGAVDCKTAPRKIIHICIYIYMKARGGSNWDTMSKLEQIVAFERWIDERRKKYE